ncbi:MAG: protecting protein DprA protein [Candidatus Woesebacteria bacterium GW2011_GWB1_43_14]|uniref:Protecting protein DprA protein n=1 Tax=Candidatus Woesebacteria bacterium GW2011_GWB1_43_14 TaxID=1618578 RepID=A0A0G1FR04_9BACT|nr:MAG: protecting protein DprA protein [Candidatus Woesebacteria bacterium GW2011_GWC1_42_9]KKS97466.1 MAG: protecting protein DprA protein [Candidatus Woesebacteria bacterium GW2011_GWB1_43_14]
MKWEDYPIEKITLKDKEYPKILKKIADPPKALYFRGSLRSNLFKKSLAVVGARRMTRYGHEVIERFIPDLVANGVTIVSGFMYGVDTVAHTEVVQNQGITVAVLGSGINTCYPPENDKLYTKILLGDGLVLSEFPPEVKPKLWMYPRRNRIVSGLSSLGTLVVEAGGKSGSLITANFALEQKRNVYAVPGPITSSVSMGTNNLIKTGQAKLVVNAADILGTPTNKKELSDMVLNPLEEKIYKSLKREPLSVDELAVDTGEALVEIAKATSLMSLKGLITEAAGKYYPS